MRKILLDLNKRSRKFAVIVLELFLKRVNALSNAHVIRLHEFAVASLKPISAVRFDQLDVVSAEKFHKFIVRLQQFKNLCMWSKVAERNEWCQCNCDLEGVKRMLTTLTFADFFSYLWLVIWIFVDVWMFSMQFFSFRFTWMNLNAQSFSNAENFEEKLKFWLSANISLSIFLNEITEKLAGFFHFRLP